MACHRRGSDCAAIFSNRNHIVVAHPPIGDPPVAAVPGRRYASLMTLDELGILCGTDKSSLRKAYLSHYERLFAPLRDTAFNLIEIGAYNGVSLRTWAEYFPRAFIVGIDIEPNAAKLAEDRIAVRIGSQADAQFLTGVAAEFPPLIVVDDGSHQADHQIASFACLFPKLRPGGCYVCEDLT